jgi:hypothetical protein
MNDQTLNMKETQLLHPKWYELNKHTDRENLTKQALKILI